MNAPGSNATDRFEKLAARARQEAVPPLDVTAGVLARIASVPAPSRSDAAGSSVPLSVVAGACVLAASVMLALTLWAWSPLNDPLAGFFEPFTVVMR